MTDYVLIATGLAVMALGDLNLVRSGLRSWIDLDEDARAIFDRDRAESQELVLSVQLWLPILGILAAVLLFKSTVAAAIRLPVPDLLLAVLYTASAMLLFWGPSALLYAVAARYATRLAAARAREAGRSSSESRRREAEKLWRSVIAAGHLATGFGVISITGFPGWIGIFFGLVWVGRRFKYRKLHLEHCRSSERTALRLRSDRA